MKGAYRPNVLVLRVFSRRSARPRPKRPCNLGHGDGDVHQESAIFLERRKGEVRSSPGPMGEKFSGSWSVTSRHPLIHNGATNATWSGAFRPQNGATMPLLGTCG